VVIVAELHITVKPDGEVEIDAVGYSGTGCLEASRPYEKALGAVVNRKKKPEILSGGSEAMNSNVNRNRTDY
jgi:hypothetical protein